MAIDNKILDQVLSEIDKSAFVLLVNPQRPDGDSLGSALALAHHFDDRDKNHGVFCIDEPPTSFRYLPAVDKFVNDISQFDFKEIETAIVFDCGDLELTKIDNHLKAAKHQPITIVNIDHHHTNDHFGHINLIDVQAASTTEIVYEVIDKMGGRITREIATCLLTGILTDTASFSNPNTTTASLRISAELLNYGAQLRQITRHTLKNKSLNILKLWGRAFSRLKEDKKTGFVVTVITQKDLEDCQVDDEATEGVANFLNNLTGTKAALVLRELPDGQIKGSLRTTDPEMDVSLIAEKYGGGGHKKAAGFTIAGRLKETPQGWEIVRI